MSICTIWLESCWICCWNCSDKTTGHDIKFVESAGELALCMLFGGVLIGACLVPLFTPNSLSSSFLSVASTFLSSVFNSLTISVSSLFLYCSPNFIYSMLFLLPEFAGCSLL